MLVHISSGNGVDEVCRALWHFLRWIDGEFAFEVIELDEGSCTRCYRSILLQSDDSRILALAGTLLWRSQSPFRPKHKRKNWYFSLSCYSQTHTHQIDRQKIIYQTMKSPKKGGQHVNTTCSGVRAIYPPSGVEAISYEERSQHQNKKIALSRLLHKVQLLKQQSISHNRQKLWREGKTVSRGEAVKVFVGSGFEEA
ncbi:MAG: peptide chain release factor-like protein [Campylobacterota bacterium]|nr:peptide chain release factor-like protein [Campylobacterota bacterium]